MKTIYESIAGKWREFLICTLILWVLALLFDVRTYKRIAEHAIEQGVEASTNLSYAIDNHLETVRCLEIATEIIKRQHFQITNQVTGVAALQVTNRIQEMIYLTNSVDVIKPAHRPLHNNLEAAGWRDLYLEKIEAIEQRVEQLENQRTNK